LSLCGRHHCIYIYLIFPISSLSLCPRLQYNYIRILIVSDSSSFLCFKFLIVCLFLFIFYIYLYLCLFFMFYFCSFVCLFVCLFVLFLCLKQFNLYKTYTRRTKWQWQHIIFPIIISTNMSVTHRSYRKLIFNVLIDQTCFIEQIDISCFTTPHYRELT
jgi:hypothetical protein